MLYPKNWLERRQRELAESYLRDAQDVVDRLLTRVANEHLLNQPHMEPVRRKLLEDALEFHQRFLEQ